MAQSNAKTPSPPEFHHYQKGNPIEDDISSEIRWSTITHILFFVAILTKQFIFTSPPKVHIPRVRVDLVGLPDLKKAQKAGADSLGHSNNIDEMAEIRKKLAQVDEVIKKEREALKKSQKELAKVPAKQSNDEPRESITTSNKDRKKQLNSAIERMKALSKLEEAGESGNPEYKGNVLSQGTARVGSADGEANAYIDLVLERIRENWNLPIWLAKQNLSAKVVLYLQPNGAIKEIQFQKFSGNDQFDQYVKQTIRMSSPFPPISNDTQDLLDGGIYLGFPL